ncbi:MAG: AMP-binding protein, partial [Rhodospirillaceae bacterium]
MSGSDTDFPGAPFRPCPLAKPSLNVERRTDGSVILTSNDPLRAYDRQIGEWVRRWAGERPDTVFLAERDGTGDWRRVNYAETRRMCDALSQALLDKGLGPVRPLVILSEKSVNFGLLALAAMQAGIPVSPISPSYSLASQDFSILKPIFELLKPGLIYVEDGAKFEKALKAIDDGSFEVSVTRNPPAGFKVTGFDELAATAPTGAVDKAFDAVKGSDTAKY